MLDNREYRPSIRPPLLSLLLLLFSPAWLSAQVAFWPEEMISSATGEMRLSRNANRSLALDSAGRLHAVYYKGGFKTAPDTPSWVYYRMRSPLSGWSTETSVDDSYPGAAASGTHLGGREPSIVTDASDTVWIVWHDSRHCMQTPGNWINNLEIYADSRVISGTFSRSDLRLTNTAAAHLGDNGYNPKAFVGADGRFYVGWYDFHFDYGVSDLFLLNATTASDLSARPMTETRVTVYPGSGRSAYTLVDFVVDASGVAHCVWTTGTGTNGNLYYGRRAPGESVLTETLLALNASNFFDPPHVALAGNNDVWIAWADKRFGSSEEIYIRRLPAGSLTFDPEIRITNHGARQYNADLEIDSAGRVHLAWADERDGNAEIYYGVYDPATPGLLFQQRVTNAPGTSIRPCLLVGSDGAVYLLWEDSRSGEARVYFTTSAAPSGTGTEWRAYR